MKHYVFLWSCGLLTGRALEQAYTVAGPLQPVTIITLGFAVVAFLGFFFGRPSAR
jgi:hypothetical protein